MNPNKMKKLYFYRKIIFVLCLFTTSFLYAHGSLSKRIKEKTAEIEKHPKNSTLYFERGFLYEQHEEFNKAIEDYLKSEELGYSKYLLLHYRKAQTYYHNYNFYKALESSSLYLKKDSVDVKINKLHAQILVQLNKHQKAIKYYSYFVNNAIDINPNDIIEYSTIYLEKDKNYTTALEVLEVGLQKLGIDIFSLQLKKLDYLEASFQIDKAIEQYNYFILNTNRKEFWYYKKATYLSENNKNEDAIIAVQQAKFAVLALNDKFQNTIAIKDLQSKIYNLENKITIKN